MSIKTLLRLVLVVAGLIVLRPVHGRSASLAATDDFCCTAQTESYPCDTDDDCVTDCVNRNGSGNQQKCETCCLPLFSRGG